MPTGSFTFGYLPPAQYSRAVPSLVFNYDGQGNLSLIPNVVCTRISSRSGPYPATAQFTYELDDTYAATLGWPSQAEQIFPIDAPESPYVVENDDRLVVAVQNSNGVIAILFDGFAQIPQVDMTPDSQQITFSAVSVAAREWDAPIKGRLQRNADNPTVDITGPIDTDLPCRFNPSDTTIAHGNKGGIRPNCTPLNSDVNEADDSNSYPVFLDPNIEVPSGTESPLTYWSISKSCRYVMAIGNPKEAYVANPDFTTLTQLLEAYAPPTGSDILEQDEDEDTGSDITVRDFDASDKAWPDAVHELLGYAGFEFSFVTSAGLSGAPNTQLNIYRNDALTTVAPKQVWLQPAGGTLGQAPNNAGSFHLARDCNNIVNQYSIESPLRQVEASFILAPLYTPNEADFFPGPMGRGQYIKSTWTATTPATIRRLYRWYGMDEIGEGHWDDFDAAFLKDAYDFGNPTSGLFPPKSDGTPQYVRRYRPGSRSLISLDSDGHPLKADLSISFNYLTVGPSIWNGTGDWTKINGGWDLLPDRLGIEVTIDDPENWTAGKGPGNEIRGVSYWANPFGANVIPPTFAGEPTLSGNSPTLRLTTVIQDDRMMSVIAPKRSASPTQFTRRRRADARDHFQYNRVLALSMYNTKGKDIIARDDTSLAMAHAVGLRGKTEFPPVAGSVTIPFITDYYQLGDRISQINGRNISLQSNVGASTGEAPNYPFVVGLDWVLQPHQETHLTLSDHRADAVNL